MLRSNILNFFRISASHVLLTFLNETVSIGCTFFFQFAQTNRKQNNIYYSAATLKTRKQYNNNNNNNNNNINNNNNNKDLKTKLYMYSTIEDVALTNIRRETNCCS